MEWAHYKMLVQLYVFYVFFFPSFTRIGSSSCVTWEHVNRNFMRDRNGGGWEYLRRVGLETIKQCKGKYHLMITILDNSKNILGIVHPSCISYVLPYEALFLVYPTISTTSGIRRIQMLLLLKQLLEQGSDFWQPSVKYTSSQSRATLYWTSKCLICKI